MTSVAFDATFDQRIRSHENKLFFKQWLKYPGQLGTLAPITVSLARAAANEVQDKLSHVVEIGAGTGRLTRALLESGVLPENLAAIELDAFMCEFLNDTLPYLLPQSSRLPHIIHGDACDLPELIPQSWVGHVSTVVSAVPLMYLNEQLRFKLIQSAFKVLRPGGSIIHVTYSPKSPLAFTNLIKQERLISKWLNVPPGFVWQYTQG